uniref:Ig-like domain-containing protein n=1 Tax=Calidris pygmaea TaxID=425635 RepID=A0A8C3K3N0_9CHAR
MVPVCSLLLISPALCSAQLLFNATDVVKKTDCNGTVILPCYVINLNENNINIMFVKWKRQGKIIFSFDGERKQFFRDTSVPSANLLSETDLAKGVASLKLKNAEAEVGNYSCEVTESNREGETKLELKKYAGKLPATVLEPVGRENKQNLNGKEKNNEYGNVLQKTYNLKHIRVFFLPFFFANSLGSWFLLVERAFIISLLFLIIILWLAQLSLIGKYGSLILCNY